LPTKRLLPLIPAGLVVLQVLPAAERITIVTAPKPDTGICPDCDRPTKRIHSRYTRRLADLPWQGRAVRIEVRARRFRCSGASGCPR
jgi:transposase